VILIRHEQAEFNRVFSIGERRSHVHFALNAQVSLYLRKTPPKCQGQRLSPAARQKEIRTNCLKFDSSDFENRGIAGQSGRFGNGFGHRQLATASTSDAGLFLLGSYQASAFRHPMRS
jgi:hypothetical protein